MVKSLRPSPEFRHRLGLGKPLGLGTVEVAIEGVFLIDRVARYTKDPLGAPVIIRSGVRHLVSPRNLGLGITPEKPSTSRK